MENGINFTALFNQVRSDFPDAEIRARGAPHPTNLCIMWYVEEDKFTIEPTTTGKICLCSDVDDVETHFPIDNNYDYCDAEATPILWEKVKKHFGIENAPTDKNV